MDRSIFKGLDLTRGKRLLRAAAARTPWFLCLYTDTGGFPFSFSFSGGGLASFFTSLSFSIFDLMPCRILADGNQNMGSAGYGR